MSHITYIVYSNIIDNNTDIFIAPHLYCTSGPIQNVCIKHIQPVGCIIYIAMETLLPFFK